MGGRGPACMQSTLQASAEEIITLLHVQIYRDAPNFTFARPGQLSSWSTPGPELTGPWRRAATNRGATSPPSASGMDAEVALDGVGGGHPESQAVAPGEGRESGSRPARISHQSPTASDGAW